MPDPLLRAFREVPLLYIADGHHRAASASRARAALRDKNPNHTGDEEYNRFLAVLFPSDQMQILPYNRVVKDFHEHTPDEFLAAVKGKFHVETGSSAVPERGSFGMYFRQHWYKLTPLDAPTDDDDPTATLDVSVLQNNLLDPLLGIKDVRTDKRIDFIGGIRGTSELEKLVNEGRAAVAFSVSPTTIEDLLRVSDAKGIMPPKSTWFEPKLRDGLLIHRI
jgi:uncharacterized protein (DUF1015 family)